MKNFRVLRIRSETERYFEIYQKDPNERSLNPVYHIPIDKSSISRGIMANFFNPQHGTKTNLFIPRPLDGGYLVLSLIFGPLDIEKPKHPESYISKKLTLRVKNFDGS